jgi:hypothetical protein
MTHVQEERFHDIDHMAFFIRFRFQRVHGYRYQWILFNKSSTCQWKGFNFYGRRSVDKDGPFYSMHQNCNRGRVN